MNTELRRNTKNDFGNSFFKLMNYPVFEETMAMGNMETSSL